MSVLCCVTARAKWIEKSGPGVKKIVRNYLKSVLWSPQYLSTHPPLSRGTGWGVKN